MTIITRPNDPSRATKTPILATYLSGTAWLIELPSQIVIINARSVSHAEMMKFVMEKVESAATRGEQVIWIDLSKAKAVYPLDTGNAEKLYQFYDPKKFGEPSQDGIPIPENDTVAFGNANLTGLRDRKGNMQVLLRLQHLTLFHPGESNQVMKAFTDKVDIAFLPKALQKEQDARIESMLPADNYFFVGIFRRPSADLFSRIFGLTPRRRQSDIPKPRWPGNAFLVYTRQLL